jgi:hypothetical protein
MMTDPIDTWLARHWMDLAGNLEAEIDRLRAEVVELGFSRTHAIRARDSAVRANAQLNATIARVRELCDETDARTPGVNFLAVHLIRGALDGNTDGTG